MTELTGRGQTLPYSVSTSQPPPQLRQISKHPEGENIGGDKDQAQLKRQVEICFARSATCLKVTTLHN
jgi:hypothetical protein